MSDKELDTGEIFAELKMILNGTLDSQDIKSEPTEIDDEFEKLKPFISQFWDEQMFEERLTDVVAAQMLVDRLKVFKNKHIANFKSINRPDDAATIAKIDAWRCKEFSRKCRMSLEESLATNFDAESRKPFEKKIRLWERYENIATISSRIDGSYRFL